MDLAVGYDHEGITKRVDMDNVLNNVLYHEY